MKGVHNYTGDNSPITATVNLSPSKNELKIILAEFLKVLEG